MLQAVDALREAADGEDFVLLVPGVVDGMLRVLPADEISFNDLDVCARHSFTLELWPIKAAEASRGALWEQCWDTLTCSFTERVGRHRGEVMTTGGFHSDRRWHSTVMCTDPIGPPRAGAALVMPLPAPPGIARRLVFLRRPGPFGEEDRSAAVLLQPHIADALRCQSRRAAARLLTGRQRELLRLVAAGHDNIAIARKLGLSPGTVRKHLENAFARLEVSSRTAAVAKVFPDAAWR